MLGEVGRFGSSATLTKRLVGKKARHAIGTGNARARELFAEFDRLRSAEVFAAVSTLAWLRERKGDLEGNAQSLRSGG